MRFETATETAGAVRDLYSERLGFPLDGAAAGDVLRARVGPATMAFATAAPGAAPFYHFALLLPGDRFEAAHEWLSERTEPLEDPGEGTTAFDFDDWDARACYFLDPAGNIVELVAHRGIAESGRTGPFEAGEMAGFSEIGIVVDDKAATAAALERETGLVVWDGEAEEPGRLAFVGERGRTLILSPRGRGWLPTGRPAEAHPLEVVVRGPRAGRVEVPGTGQRVVSALDG